MFSSRGRIHKLKAQVWARMFFPGVILPSSLGIKANTAQHQFSFLHRVFKYSVRVTYKHEIIRKKLL